MPATIFSSASEVKSYGSNLSLNDVTKILSVSGNPASGAGTAAPVGSIALDYSNGKTYKKTGSLATEWAELGSGVGGINYIVNPDAESGTTGWSTYADAAGAQPVDGTGGSPSVTWTRSTTTPLRGTGDFNFVKDAVNRQGQGVSYDVTVDNADLARVLTVSFDYEVLSGTYATGDLTVYLIQDPTGTPVVIQPAGFQVVAATAGTKMTQIATFQTDVAQKSYRLCFHVATTSASAYTLALDNIVVGPAQKVYGAPVTDWKSYTPTIANGGTTTLNAGNYRQIGDSMNINIITIYSGAGAAAALTYQLPAGYSIDTTKLPSSSTDQSIVGICQWYDASTSQERTGSVVYRSATTVALVIDNNGSAVLQGSALANLDWIRLNFSVPILGWSSNVEVSSSTDTRVVSFNGTQASQALTANTTLLTLTAVKDTHGAWVTNTYTVAVPGDYVVNGAYIGTGAGALQIYKNGSAVSGAYLGSVPGASTAGGGSIMLPSLVSGDTITLRCTASITVSNVIIGVFRLSGPSAIAASETVAARYTSSAGNAVANNTTTYVDFATKDYDTHGIVLGAGSGNVTVTNTGWRAIIPVPGKYLIITKTISASGGGWAAGEYWENHIRKNDVQIESNFSASQATHSTFMGTHVASVIGCLAGDRIEISCKQTSGASLNIVNNAEYNSIEIVRVGN